MEKRKPGRPKKAVPNTSGMADVVIQEMKEQATAQSSTPDREPVVSKVELKDIAYSITRNPVNQRWVVLQIPYDIKTGQVGEIKRVEENPERIVIIERFKVLTGNDFMT